MQADTFFIVYASGTKAIRRVICPDDNSQPVFVSEGEEFLEFSMKEWGDLDQWKALIERSTGVYPPDPICAVVDPKDGTVLDIIMADPALDEHPEGHDLVTAYSDKIEVGDTYNAETEQFFKAVSAELIENPASAEVALK